MLTDQNSSKIEKRSCQLCFKNDKAENTGVFFKYGAIKGRRMVLFLLSKKCGPSPPF